MRRPGVVWFGEMLPEAAVCAAERAVEACDFFASIGTSAVVQPAASLLYRAKAAGAWTLEINLDPTPATADADLALRGRAGEILPALLE